MEIALTRRIVPAHERKAFSPLDGEAIARRTHCLPPAFELIPRLLVLLDDPDVNAEKIADVIRLDAGLTANVLQLANSVSFAAPRKTKSLSEAVVRVGLREVFRAVVKTVTSPALTSQSSLDRQPINLWQHSLAAAVAAQVLARHLEVEDTETAFTAGLLHDIGKVILAQALAQDYIRVLECCAENNRAIHIAEREAFLADHTEIGGRVLRDWKFPDRIVAAVLRHHAPLTATREHAPLAALIYAANVLAYYVGRGAGYPEHVVHPDEHALELINLEKHTLLIYEEEVTEMIRREEERLC
jgi:putative nucleotidyltransferase with HDIG domain